MIELELSTSRKDRLRVANCKKRHDEGSRFTVPVPLYLIVFRETNPCPLQDLFGLVGQFTFESYKELPAKLRDAVSSLNR
jgi:hypothetical protein